MTVICLVETLIMVIHVLQRWLISWNVFAVAISTLLALPKMYNIPTLTPTVIFWIHKLTYFFFIDIFHGIILPMNMRIPLDLGRSKVGEFYVRKPNIEPRRSEAEEKTRRKFLSRREELKTFSHRNGRIREDEDAGSGGICDVQPSTSFQHTQTVSGPAAASGEPSNCQSTLSLPPRPPPLSLNLSVHGVLQVHPTSFTPEPLPKVFRRNSGFEADWRRSTTIYCRTCEACAREKGKGKGKGKEKKGKGKGKRKESERKRKGKGGDPT